MTNSTSNTLTTGQQLRDGVPTFSEQVRGTGFVVLRKPELAGLISDADLEELRGAWENLPVDTQVHGVGVYRERRYGRLRADVDGDTVTLEVLPNAVFRQDAIPLWEGKDRVFEPIAEDVLLSPGLRAPGRLRRPDGDRGQRQHRVEGRGSSGPRRRPRRLRRACPPPRAATATDIPASACT